MPTKTQSLTRYSIIIESAHEKVDDLRIFLQKCLWTQSSHSRTDITHILYGFNDEYSIYNCDLSDEDLLCLKLKFNGIASVTPHNPMRTNDHTFKAATGELYYHSTEARLNRAVNKFALKPGQYTISKKIKL